MHEVKHAWGISPFIMKEGKLKNTGQLPCNLEVWSHWAMFLQRVVLGFLSIVKEFTLDYL